MNMLNGFIGFQLHVNCSNVRM